MQGRIRRRRLETKDIDMTPEERRFLEQIRSLRLTVSPQHTLRLLRQVEHKMFSDALEANWELEHRTVTPQSVCWLFCWAKTGINSRRTAEHCRRLFNKIFDGAYSDLDCASFHKFARKFRYQRR